MDIALTETQTLLREAMRDYLQKEIEFNRIRRLEQEGGYDLELWSYLQTAGFLGLPFPESLGGGGGELTDLAVVLEELTRRAVVIPFLETMVSALAIQRHGDAAAAEEIVAGVAGGKMTLSPALLEKNDRFGTPAATVTNGKLTGDKHFVDYGDRKSVV